jgi:metal-responsive CopG/Arc/MetJ family transcriptional regulator
MTYATKLKVSLTLSSDLVELVDRAAERSNTTRSGMVERWLRAGASHAAERALDDATRAYYLARSAEAEADDNEIGRATSRAARAAVYDAPRARARGARRLR